MNDLFKDLIEDLQKVTEMVEKVDKALNSDSPDSDPVKDAAEAADIDLDNAMEPADKLHPTIEEAKEENKQLTKLEEALTKKIQEMIENG